VKAERCGPYFNALKLLAALVRVSLVSSNQFPEVEKNIRPPFPRTLLTLCCSKRHLAHPAHYLHDRPQYRAENGTLGPRVQEMHYVEFAAKLAASARLRHSRCYSASTSTAAWSSVVRFENGSRVGTLVSIVKNA